MLIAQHGAVEQENELNVVRLSLEIPAAAASAFQDFTQKFTNQRQWREFLSALHCPVNYPAVVRLFSAEGMTEMSLPVGGVYVFRPTDNGRTPKLYAVPMP